MKKLAAQKHSSFLKSLTGEVSGLKTLSKGVSAQRLSSESNQPVAADAKPGTGIHHPKFGEKLKEKMDALKIECVLKQQNDYRANGGNLNEDMVKFFLKHFRDKKDQTAPSRAAAKSE